MRKIHLTLNTGTKTLLAGMAMLVAAMVIPDLAHAASNLGGAADSATREFTSFGKLARAGFSITGFVSVGLGLYKIMMAKKTNEPMGLGIGMAVIGAVLLVLPTVIGLTTQSAVQTDAGDGLDPIGVGK